MSTLDGASRMKSPLCFNVGRVCEFGSWKAADVDFPAIDADHCAPTVYWASDSAHDTKKSMLAIALCRASVLIVYALRHVTQIADCVVRWVEVYVIYGVEGPYAVGMQPCESVRLVHAPIDTDFSISERIGTASDHPFLRSARVRTSPRQDARKVVVVEQFTNQFGGKIRVSHRALRMLGGEGLGRIASAFQAPTLYAAGAF